LGILGYSVVSCAHTAAATRIWHQYNPLFFGSLIKAVFEQSGSQIRVTHIPATGIREDLLQFLIEEKICYDMALQRLIGLPAFPISHLSLTYKQPAHAQLYRDLINCPIEFSAPSNIMKLSDNAFTLPLRGSDPETHEHCMKLLNQVSLSVTSDTGMAHRVRAILHENMAAQPAITEIAAALGCTTRTLHRALTKEGLNYRTLHSECRLETIKNLFATTHLETTEIAALAGFSDVRSLRRFFKAQTNQTPKRFRIETIN
jgi:AraC-like DNA-binding protein